MSRLAVTLLSFSVVVSAGRVDAEELHKTWRKYLKGEWSYVITPRNAKGTATWRLAAKGNASVGRFVEEDGTTSIEIGGWQSDTKTMTANGYGSAGNYWVLKFNKITRDRIEGPNHGLTPDGTTYKGTFIGKRVDDDHYEFHFTGKDGDGEDFKMTGKFVRKKE